MSDNTSVAPVARIVSAFIDAKITVVLVIAAAIFGLIAIVLTPREENPRITVPTAVITTDDPGRSRDEIMRLITLPLERVIGQISGVEHVYDTSVDGRSTITVRYRVGTDATDAYVDLYTRLLGNRAVIPRDAADPVVSRIDVDDVPIVVVTLASASRDEASLRDIAYRLSDAITPVPGVGTIALYGGRTRSVNVVIEPAQLSAYGLGFANLEAALQQSSERTAGFITNGITRTELRAGAPFRSASDVASATVAIRDGVPISLREVALISDAVAPRTSYVWYARAGSRHEGAVSLAVAKRSGTNIVQVSSAVLAAVDRFSLPAGVRIDVTRDDGAKANGAVDELFHRLIEGIAIVSILLIVTLGWREAAIVGLTIPLTLFITLGVAMLLHQTINRITLFALILSLGLLVDDAIVVIENIHRQMQAGGRDPRTIVANAVAQVASPTILATATVILAFLPMAYVTGLMGPYMRPIPLDVPVAMVTSLIVAIVVAPWAAIRFLKTHRAGSERRPSRWLLLYRNVLGSFLDRAGHRRLFLGLVTLALLVAISLPVAQLVRFRMLPSQNENTFSVAIDEPVGTDLERTRAAATAIEARLLAEPTVRDIETFVGTHGVPDFNGFLRGSFFRDAAWFGELRVNLVDKGSRHESSEEIVRRLRPTLVAAGSPYAAAVRLIEEPPGPPVRATVLGVISGATATGRADLAHRLFGLVSAQAGVIDVDTTAKQEPDHAQVIFDLRKAALSGVQPQFAAREVDAAFAGLDAGVIRDPDARDPVPIFVRYGDQRRRNIGTLSQTAIPNATGKMVPLSTIARMVMQPTSPTAYREDGRDVTYVSGEMAGRSSTYAVIDLLLALARTNAVPSGYAVHWDGEWQLTLDVFRDLGLAMGVAIVLIYIVLVARFRSLRVPLVILSAVPLGLIGVLPGFALLAPFGIYFSATAMIGVIALSGIVVRNSIVLVEYIEERIAHGAPLREALLDAGGMRARPIALTAAAGMLSAVVIAFDPVWSGLAWALVFGMGASAALSLFVIPVLYAMATRTRAVPDRSAALEADVPARIPTVV